MRRFFVLAALCLVCAPAAVGGAPPSLTLDLDSGGNLAVIFPNGTHVVSSSSSALVAPGDYQAVLVDDVPYAQDSYHVFHLSGPGVDMIFDLVCFRTQANFVTLLPNATYVFRDDRQPGLGRVVFTTAASGTPGPGPASPTTSGGKSGTTSNQSLLGSAVVYRGTLAGTVGADGKVTLARGGKAVTTLRAGRYTVVVRDASAARGFALQRGKTGPVVLTSAAFVGKRTTIVQLRAGQWTFSSPGGAKSSFVVAAA